MSWFRRGRRPDRQGRKPRLQELEPRCLLSTAPSYDNLVHASSVRLAYHVDGQGQSAAVIDTGVNYDHDALGNGFGPGHKVVGGYDLAEGDDDPAATWQHGTHVAGLLASSDPEHLGVAPGAEIVALRVFGDDNAGDFDRIADALQWVIDHHDEYNITVVNLSISDSRNYTMNWFAFDGDVGQRITGLVHQLRELRIPVVTATGNGFKGSQGMGFIAILPETISVTAVDANDRVTADAQRLGSTLGGALATDLAAPGAGLTAPSSGESYTSVDGTSFAAPLVSGAILLLQQIYQGRFHTLPTVDQLESWLKQGARTITDETTGITLSSLDLAGAAALVPAAPAVPSEPTPSEPTPSEPTPSEPTPSEPVESVKLYRDGQYVGSVAADSSDNPLRDVFAAFGLQGTLETASTWRATTTRAAAKPATAAASNHRVTTIAPKGPRRAFLAALEGARSSPSFFKSTAAARFQARRAAMVDWAGAR